MAQNNYSVTLSQWIYGKTDDELRNLFFNMDLTMKYIHEKGYCIKSFDLNKIEILNNSPEQIKFNTLLKLPNDYSIDNELIREDIYNSAFIQIGIYSNCLKYLKPNFLKEHFDSFAMFLPEKDIPYYRGIVQRGANIYFSNYVTEKRKRDIDAMNNQFYSNGDGNSNGKSLVKRNGNFKSDSGDYESINDKINDVIYRQLNNKKDAAFIGFLIFPMIIFIVGIAILFMILFSKML